MRDLEPALHRASRPFLPPADGCGMHPRAAAASPPLAPASARESALPSWTSPRPEYGRRPRPRDAPSGSFSSETSMDASPLPPTSMNATSGPIATMVPSMVCPCSKRFALSDASNIAAKSSSSRLGHGTLLTPLGRTIHSRPWRHMPQGSRQPCAFRRGGVIRGPVSFSRRSGGQEEIHFCPAARGVGVLSDAEG